MGASEALWVFDKLQEYGALNRRTFNTYVKEALYGDTGISEGSEAYSRLLRQVFTEIGESRGSPGHRPAGSGQDDSIDVLTTEYLRDMLTRASNGKRYVRDPAFDEFPDGVYQEAHSLLHPEVMRFVGKYESPGLFRSAPNEGLEETSEFPERINTQNNIMSRMPEEILPVFTSPVETIDTRISPYPVRPDGKW